MTGPEESFLLGGKEFQLAEILFRNKGKVITSKTILKNIWGMDNEIDILWVNVSTLRKKMKQAGMNVTIKATRGVGYCLTELKDIKKPV